MGNIVNTVNLESFFIFIKQDKFPNSSEKPTNCGNEASI